MAEASIVFRDEVMNGTGKIYIDTIEAAASLAAHYRNASHLVDVVDERDQVALRYEDGAPDWLRSQLQSFARGVEPYRFERADAPLWDAENRLRLLSEALPYAFDTAIGQANVRDLEQFLVRAEHHDDDDIFEMFRDARKTAAAAAKASSSEEWAETIGCWMTDPSRLFVTFAVEQAALWMKISVIGVELPVPALSAKLAILEAARAVLPSD